jgi:hypothetical protein
LGLKGTRYGEWRRQYNKGFMICIPQKFYSADQIKKSEIGGTCVMYRSQERDV